MDASRTSRDQRQIPINVARPIKYDVDTSKVQSLASFGNTYPEIASVLGVSEDILQKRYSTFYLKGRQSLKQRLRKKQINVALKGNVVMLIWLGKQYLGQSDKNEMELIVDASEIAKKFAEMVSAAGAGSATPNN